VKIGWQQKLVIVNKARDLKIKRFNFQHRHGGINQWFPQTSKKNFGVKVK